MAANVSTVDICDEVTFTVETDPAGYENDVEWIGGGCFEEIADDTYKTAWECIGLKMVTATICNSSVQVGVTVELQDYCGMAGEHDSSVDWNYHDNLMVCDTGPDANAPDWATLSGMSGSGIYDWHYNDDDEFVSYDVAFKYRESACTWVCEISDVRTDTAILIYDPDCESIGLTSISSPSEDLCYDIGTIRSDLFDANLDDDQPANTDPTTYWCYDGWLAHEEKHRADWEDMYGGKLAVAIANCEELEVAIDCNDGNTWSCDDAFYSKKSDIEDAFAQALQQARDLFNDPSTSKDDAEQRAFEAQAAIQNQLVIDFENFCNSD